MKENDKTTVAKWILGCCVVVPLCLASLVYAVLSWGFCLSTAWNWYMVPIFHYPPLTLLEAWVLIMVLSLARPNIDGWKHELDIGKTIGFFNSLNIKHTFCRDSNTLIFRTNFDKLSNQ